VDKRIVDQLNVALLALKLKQKNEPEAVINSYIEKYQSTLTTINSNASESEKRKALDSLKRCARGYLETSSNYTQDFFQEMDKLETLL
jgi:hypothetical protein